MPEYVALLRGINVGGRNKLPMAEVRSVCSALGWDEVETYIQSGNVLFTAEKKGAELEIELEQAIEQHFRLDVPVIVRSADDWSTYLGTNPFPEASATEPNLVMLALSKNGMNPETAKSLQERAGAGERLEEAKGALWIFYPNGSGRSKLSPALLDRAAGSAVTTRNWRTVLKLAELLGLRSG